MKKTCFVHFLLRSPVILLFLSYLILLHFPKKHFFNACSDLGPPGDPQKIDRSFLAPLGRRLGPRTCFQDRLGTFQKTFKASQLRKRLNEAETKSKEQGRRKSINEANKGIQKIQEILKDDKKNEIKGKKRK